MSKSTSTMDIITFSAVAIAIALMLKLTVDNRDLSEKNGTLQGQIAQLNTNNEGMAKSLEKLTGEMQAMNKLASDEARRRAAAEMKSQRLNEEVKDALKSQRCAIELLPDGVIIGVRKAADSARGGDGKAGSNPSQSAS